MLSRFGKAQLGKRAMFDEGLKWVFDLYGGPSERKQKAMLDYDCFFLPIGKTCLKDVLTTSFGPQEDFHGKSFRLLDPKKIGNSKRCLLNAMPPPPDPGASLARTWCWKLQRGG